MVCRSTPGNSALTTWARLYSGVDDVQVLSMFHEQRSAAPSDADTPDRAEYRRFLGDLRAAIVTGDHGLSLARQTSLLTRLQRAEAQIPDRATYYAWRTITDRAVRARAALDAHLALAATRHGVPLEDVRTQFAHLVEANRAQGRTAPRPPRHTYDTAGLPADRATRYALHVLHDIEPPPGVPRCPHCGRWAAQSHTCTTTPPAATPASTHAPAEPAVAPRMRTALRSYVDDTGAAVRMTNLSQVRADVRAAGLGAPVPVPVATTAQDPQDGTHQIAGTVMVTATSARARAGTDRLEVSTAPDAHRLACTCAQYADTYDCPHVQQVSERVAAILNDRDTRPAIAPVAAVQQVRAVLHEDYQASLTAQQRARADFTAHESTAWSQDMAAFQQAWDATKARLATGDTAIPYLTQDVTGGLGAREGGRSFGIEIEVDFPDDMSLQAKHRVAREMHEAGLTQSPQVQGWHYSGRTRDARGRPMGGGYSDDPSRWAVEFDRSVDDVNGARGCEIVSPIMYDEPQTWANIAKVCEIVERHGGRATPRTGLHVNVGAADFDHTVGNHNTLLQLATAYEDVLVRCAHNPASGPSHRGRAYCAPNAVPAAGYQSIRDAQHANGHRSMINLDHVPAEGQAITNSTRVEVRIFDGTTDKGRLQTNIKVALGLVNAAARGAVPTIPAEPAGTHRRTRTPGRLTGEAWEADTASFRALADNLFARAQDKDQLVAAFAASRWQSH